MAKSTHPGNGFILDVEDRPGYLRAYVHGGQDCLQVAIDYWTLLWAECERRGSRKLLVVEDLVPAEISEDALNTLVVTMVGLGYSQVRIAFVSLQSPEQLNEQGAILGAEQGLVATVFTDESYADRWLRYA